MTNREAMEYASKNSFQALYEKGKADAFEKVYDRIDEGVCYICEHFLEDCECFKLCRKEGWETETIMKWLKEQMEA